MTHPWFRRVGIFFVPASIAGWLILAGAIAYLIHVFSDINRRTSSNEERLLHYIINFTIVFIGYSVVGYFTTKNSHKE